MDRQFIRLVETSYPYPIAIEFRRLNTPEYINYDYKRLKQILRTAEKTIHLISLNVLSDMIENHIKSPIPIPDSFKKEFNSRLTRSSFGKWIGLTRDSIKILLDNNIELFIKELAVFFFTPDKSPSQTQKDFNELCEIRNQLEHPNFTPSPQIFEELAHSTEEMLERIISGLEFITKYQSIFIHDVSVSYHRWLDPNFTHTIAEVSGLTNEFSSYRKEKPEFYNTPAVVIIKENSNSFLPLEPLVIYSQEGKDRIADIFLFNEWSGNKIKYTASDKGGEFNLLETTDALIYIKSMLRFFEVFALKKDYLELQQSLKDVIDLEEKGKTIGG